VAGEIPSEIGNLQNIELFNIENNNFAGPIPFEIFNISTLQDIAITLNNLSGHLPSNIGLFLPNLQKLYIGANELSGTLPSSISNASQLIDIELVQNSFSGLIPKTLGNLRLLERLNLGQNNLTVGSPELSFFSSLSNCIYLKALILSDNPLNGIMPSSVGNLFFFFFFLISKGILLKNAKRNQVYMGYTRETIKKKKKAIQGNRYN